MLAPRCARRTRSHTDVASGRYAYYGPAPRYCTRPSCPPLLFLIPRSGHVSRVVLVLYWTITSLNPSSSDTPDPAAEGEGGMSTDSDAASVTGIGGRLSRSPFLAFSSYLVSTGGITHGPDDPV